MGVWWTLIISLTIIGCKSSAILGDTRTLDTEDIGFETPSPDLELYLEGVRTEVGEQVVFPDPARPADLREELGGTVSGEDIGSFEPECACEILVGDEGAILDASLEPAFSEFAIDVGDPEGHPLRGTIFRPFAPPAPLVVLVHGLGCTREIWRSYFGMVQALLDAGFAVAAYDQRGHGESRHLAFDIPEMAKDIGRVILHLDAEFGSGPLPWIDTSRPVGLIGHSLGAYMVTIASCQVLGYLGDAASRLGVTIEGAGPDNLQELKEFLDLVKGNGFLVNLFVAGLGVYQVSEPSKWWVEWSTSGPGPQDEILAALYLAPNPIERGHGNGVSTWDNADFILTPFYVAHSLGDDIVPEIPPLSCPSDLYNDVRYNAGGPFGTWIEVNKETGYHTWSLVGHNIFLDQGVVEWVVNILRKYLLES